MRFFDEIPNCVPEFYRSQREEEERQYELETKAQEHYNQNKEKLDKAAEEGYPILNYDGYTECYDCKTKDSDTMIFAEDDIGTIICLNKHCVCHKKYATVKSEEEQKENEEEEESFLKESYKHQELLENLTIETVKSFAMKNYSKGGDAIIECMEDSEIAEVIKTKGKDGILDIMYDWYMRCMDIHFTIW